MFKREYAIIIATVLYCLIINKNDIGILKINYTNANLNFFTIIAQTVLIILIIFYNMGFIEDQYSIYSDLIIVKMSKRNYYIKEILNHTKKILIIISYTILLFMIFDISNLKNYNFLNFFSFTLSIFLILSFQNLIELIYGSETSALIISILLLINFTMYDLGNHSVFFLQHYFINPTGVKTFILIIFNLLSIILLLHMLQKKDRIGEI